MFENVKNVQEEKNKPELRPDIAEFIDYYKKYVSGLNWHSIKRRSDYEIHRFKKFEARMDAMWMKLPAEERMDIWRILQKEGYFPEAVKKIVETFGMSNVMSLKSVKPYEV
jgi:hypothetical protein